MPRNDAIHKILVIGSGPIVIGQACEFDYSGTQACKALKEEGYEVVLVNSNPATIMTDPELAEATFVRPLTPADLDQVLAVAKPDAVLPTVGGQTALNLALEASRRGILEHHGVELLGAKPEVIEKAEDRDRILDESAKLFKDVKPPTRERVREEQTFIGYEGRRAPRRRRRRRTLG